MDRSTDPPIERGLALTYKRGWLLEVIVTLFSMVLFGAVPAYTQLAQKIVCKNKQAENVPYSDDFCDSGLVTGKVSDLLFDFQLASVIPAFFVVTYFGALSDAIGRKFALIAPILGTIVFITGWLLLEIFSLDLNYMYIPQALYGFSGTWALILTAVFSAAADVTHPKHRASRFSILEGALVAGGCVGSIAGGEVLDRFGYMTFFIAADVLLALTLALTLLLPETLVKEKRRPIPSWRESNALAVMMVFLRSKELFFLGATFTLSVSVIVGWPTVSVLYLKHVYHWSAQTLGFFSAAYSGFRGVGVLFLLPLTLHWCMKRGEYRYLLAQVSGVVCAVQMVLWAFFRTDVIAFVVTALGCFTPWAVTIVRGFASELLSASEQGLLFGAIAALEACITPLSGTAIFNNVYSATVDSCVYAFLLVGAGMFVLSMVTLYFYKRDYRDGNRKYSLVLNVE